MSTDTEKNINEAIDWLQQTGGSIQDFAVEQAPLYCREVVQYELWYNGAWIAVSLACLSILIAKRKSFRALLDGGECEFFVGVFAFILLGAGFLVPFTNCIGGLTKAAVAPRLVIVEHLRGLNK